MPRSPRCREAEQRRARLRRQSPTACGGQSRLPAAREGPGRPPPLRGLSSPRGPRPQDRSSAAAAARPTTSGAPSRPFGFASRRGGRCCGNETGAVLGRRTRRRAAPRRLPGVLGRLPRLGGHGPGRAGEPSGPAEAGCPHPGCRGAQRPPACRLLRGREPGFIAVRVAEPPGLRGLKGRVKMPLGSPLKEWTLILSVETLLIFFFFTGFGE